MENNMRKILDYIICMLAFICFAKELNLHAEQILEQLMQKFSLTMEEAKAYLNETTNLM